MPESFSKFKDLEQHLVLVDSASKRFSACGARIGALLTKNEALMAQMMKLAQCRLSVATLDQIATTALYQLDRGILMRCGRISSAAGISAIKS